MAANLLHVSPLPRSGHVLFELRLHRRGSSFDGQAHFRSCLPGGIGDGSVHAEMLCPIPVRGTRASRQPPTTAPKTKNLPVHPVRTGSVRRFFAIYPVPTGLPRRFFATHPVPTGSKPKNLPRNPVGTGHFRGNLHFHPHTTPPRSPSRQAPAPRPTCRPPPACSHYGVALEGEPLLAERVRAARIPRATREHSVILATWNVRELGRRRRRDDSIRMIAHIVSRFSLVSLVELRRDTSDLERVLRVLGPAWRALYSEPLEDPGANEERACFLFDSRIVRHTGLVSVLHRKRARIGDEYVTPHWWRAPFVAGFRAGAVDLVVATAHVRWGASEAGRLGEIQALAEWAARRAQRTPQPTSLVLTGDLNVPDVTSPLYRALIRRGLSLPKALLGAHGTNLAANKRYDQILHLPKLGERFTERAGVVDFFAGDHASLYPRVRMSREAFTRQLSDHLPLWAEMRVD